MSRVKETKETPEERKARLEAKLDRLQAQKKYGNGEAFEGFEEDEVTDVIDLALKKLEAASRRIVSTVKHAASEVTAACDGRRSIVR